MCSETLFVGTDFVGCEDTFKASNLQSNDDNYNYFQSKLDSTICISRYFMAHRDSCLRKPRGNLRLQWEIYFVNNITCEIDCKQMFDLFQAVFCCDLSAPEGAVHQGSVIAQYSDAIGVVYSDTDV